jgi:hypothetical protein
MTRRTRGRTGSAGRAGRALAALALVLVAGTACSEQDAQDAVDQARDQASSAIEDADLPEVDWQKYSGELQDRLDRLADQADCQGLRDELAKAEGNDAELTRYIKAQLRKIDC